MTSATVISSEILNNKYQMRWHNDFIKEINSWLASLENFLANNLFDD